MPLKSEHVETSKSKSGPQHLEIRRFQEILKEMMFGRGLHYDDLAKALDISLSTAKRLLSGDDLSFERVLAICNWLSVDFYKVVELTRQQKIEWEYMTLDQEAYLAKHPAQYKFLRLMIRGESPTAIAKRFALDGSTVEAYLADLEALHMIELKTSGDIDDYQILVPQRADWHSHGAMWQAYFKRMVSSYVEKFFDSKRVEKNRQLEYGLRKLSASSYNKFCNEVEDLYKKYVAISEMEVETVPESRLVPMTCLILVDKFWDDWLESIEF